MFVKKCSNCQFECKKDKICERYKRPALNHTGKGRPKGNSLLRGKFEQPYYRQLREDVPEHNKWIAYDYMNLIKKYWCHDERRGGDLEVLANAILITYITFWNNGDPNGKIDENMPEDRRQSIYWQKTLTAYSYAAIDKKNEEKRLYNTMITGVSMEAVNEETEEDSGIKVEKLFTWMEEKLWDIIKTKKVRTPSGDSHRVVQGNTEMERKSRFRSTVQALKLHYIYQMGYKEISELLGRNKTELSRAVIDMVNVISDYHKEIFQE